MYKFLREVQIIILSQQMETLGSVDTYLLASKVENYDGFHYLFKVMTNARFTWKRGGEMVFWINS